MVLLENDGTLPLAPEVGRVALIGPSADDARNHLGDYAHQLHVETLLRNREVLSSAIPVADSLQPSRASRADPHGARGASRPTGRGSRVLRPRVWPARRQ